MTKERRRKHGRIGVPKTIDNDIAIRCRTLHMFLRSGWFRHNFELITIIIAYFYY